MAEKHDPYAALRFPAYRSFLLGRSFFTLAMEMQNVAVSWQIYQRLHATPRAAALALGNIGLVQVIPVLLFSLLAGQVADRFRRRTIVMSTILLFAACAAGLLGLSATAAPVSYFYVILFFSGIGRAFTVPAVTALYTSLIPRELLNNASTWNSTFFQIAAMSGPALGGIVIASAGVDTSYFINLGCAAISFALFVFIKIKGRGTRVRAPISRQGLLQGIRFVFGTRLLLAMVCLDLFAVLFGGATALLPIFARDILHGGARTYGLLRAAPAVGAVIMALVTVHLPPWKHAGRAMLWTVAGFGVATLVFGLSRWLPLSLLALALTGGFDNISVVIRQTLTQSVTPDAMRGRVSSITYIFISCSNELGEFESGITAGLFGPVGAVVLGAMGTLGVVVAACRLFPEMLQLESLHRLTPIRVEEVTQEDLIEKGN